MIMDYSKLRGRIVEKFGSQKAFARILGVSNNSVTKKMTSKTSFNQKDIHLWCTLLGIPMDNVREYFFTLKV